MRLNEDLDSGELLTTKAEAECTVWQKNVDDEYEETTRTETVVNWSSRSFGEDDFLRIKWQDGEWQPDSGGTGGGVFYGTIVPESIDCEATPSTLDVEVTVAPTCTVPDGTGYDENVIEDVQDLGDEIGLMSVVHGRSVIDLEGAFVAITKGVDLTDGYCTEVWVLHRIYGYLECNE